MIGRRAMAVVALALALLTPRPGPAIAADGTGPAGGNWSPLSAYGFLSGRYWQSAVWTGRQMLIWGGLGADGPLANGAAYDPADDSWRMLPWAGGFGPRYLASAVWTGKEMLIWGGYNGSDAGPVGDGAAYNPLTKTWRLLATAGAPSARANPTAVWTGSRMLIWGGAGGTGELTDSAAYDPASDTWSPISSVGAPSARSGQVAVWTGDRLLIWGGERSGGFDASSACPYDYHDGAAYHPATDTWTPLSTVGAPCGREGATAVWTGSRMLVYGGNAFGIGSNGPQSNGAAYDPVTDTWAPLSSAGAPPAGGGVPPIWTGSEFVYWNGDSGGRYDPVANTWTPMAAADAPSPRSEFSAVWTGRAMLVWGGTFSNQGVPDFRADGAEYVPPAGPAPHDGRYFGQTGYRIDDDAIWNYFGHRGGVRSFGYPTSRTFPFMGHTSQFFQRDVLQVFPDGTVHPLNLLDSAVSPPTADYGILPFTTFNFSVFPAADPALAAGAPNPYTDHDYATAITAFVRAVAPDTWDGLPVNFYRTFVQTVTLQDAYPDGGGNPALLPLLNLEIWGAPISAPAYDPNNHAFVYQRFQRGIMHYDAGCNCTQGILMGDYLKAIMTGQDLPADLAQEAATSPFFLLYDPNRPRWMRNPNALPYTDLTNAFAPQ
jgi:hypothetical protein